MLDTSTLIMLGRISDATHLPDEAEITAVRLAELSVGPLVATTDEKSAARRSHLQMAERDFEALPFDVSGRTSDLEVAKFIRLLRQSGIVGRWSIAPTSSAG